MGRKESNQTKKKKTSRGLSSDDSDPNFLSNPHTNDSFFFLLTIKYHIFIFQKGLPKIPESTEMQTHNTDITPRCNIRWWHHIQITLTSQRYAT